MKLLTHEIKTYFQEIKKEIKNVSILYDETLLFIKNIIIIFKSYGQLLLQIQIVNK